MKTSAWALTACAAAIAAARLSAFAQAASPKETTTVETGLIVLMLLAGAVAAIVAPLGADATREALRSFVSHPIFRSPLRRNGGTRTSGMKSFWGLLTAYWTSERWVEAWALTVGVIALTTLLSKSSVWAATTSADFLNSLVRFHSPDQGVDPVRLILLSASAFAAVHLGRIAGTGVRHLCSSTLHRKARGWMQEQFSLAILARSHVPISLTSDRDGEGSGAGRLPDNIDQRVDVCTIEVFSGFIGLSMGIWGSVASVWFISNAVIERSAPVAFLDRWGASFGELVTARYGPGIGAWADFSPGVYGSAVLVAAAVAVYVPIGMFLAWRLGRVLERQTVERQASDGAWRGEYNSLLSRAPQLAASGGERVQTRTNARLYGAIDRVWRRLNVTQANFMVFTNAYNFLALRLVAYLPALPAFLAGGMTFRAYAATSELVGELINDTSWFVQVMPAVAALRANTRRLTELAEAIDAVQDPSEFYGQTGVSDFRRETQDPAFGLTVKRLELRHRGFDADPFLTAKNLHFRPGQWTYIRGENGSGKSSFLKALAGLWPYGSGMVAWPEDAVTFFAGQEPDLPERLTLKALVCYPAFEESRSDVEVAAALADVGLGKFIRALDDELWEGRTWRSVLSGGQKQRLVLARIVLHQPDILLLDEATSAMDPTAAQDFHVIIRDRCPEATVISVIHGTEPPRDPAGRFFHDTIMQIEDGAAALHPIGSVPSARRVVAAE